MQRFPTNTSAKAGQDRSATRFKTDMAQTDNKKSWLLGATYEWNNM